MASALFSGCGAGGYAGAGLITLSRTAVHIDASQTYAFTSTEPGRGGLPEVWALVPMGTCPATGCGVVSGSGTSGNYTAPPNVANPFQVELEVTDPDVTGAAIATITIDPDPAITGPLPTGTVGTPYAAKLTVTGGTGTSKLTLSNGSLPAGLVIDANGNITGTPIMVGATTFVMQATDSSDVPFTVKANETIVVSAPAAQLIVTGTLGAATVGTPYAGTLQASGGTGPYTFSTISGALPTGLSLSSSGPISGTPTTAGTFAFTVQGQDANGLKGSGAFTISASPAPLSITTGALPNGTVGTPYSATIGVAGGTAPYSCAIVSGTLPSGLSLGANCAVTGNPNVAGTSTLSVSATDSSNPTLTATGPISITIAPMALSITTGTLPNGTVNTPYSATIGVSGGTAPYSCVITSGMLQAGLTLGANCTVSGTPTAAGTANLTVKATDSSNPALTASGPVSLTIAPASLTITTGSLPDGTVNTPYSATIGVSGGTAPYSCVIISGALQAGLTLGGNCTVSGTPTAAGTANLTVKATDSSNPALTASGPVSLTIAPASLTITTGTLPNGTVGTPYNATIGVSGGTSPYNCSIISGTLPAGLSLGANCAVNGTPTVAGSQTLFIRATDASSPTQTASGPVSITIVAGASLTLGMPPAGTVNTAYTGSIPVSGGTAPYSCTITSGALPAGLTLGANCSLSGTPTASGTSTVTVHATDSSNPALSTTGPVSITINPAQVTLVISTPPPATVGSPYTGRIPVTGGTGPYHCTLTGGSMPAGLSLNSDCGISGTPGMAGNTTVSVQATDSSNPSASNTGPVTITVNPASPTLTLSSPPPAMTGTPYTGTIGVSGGAGPYSCTITSGALPSGLTLGANCAISGTPATSGSTTVTVQATDSTTPTPATTTGPVTVTVNPGTLSLGVPPVATVGTPYTGTIPVSGGVGPYSCTLAGGTTIPAGLTLSANCAITGTPTTAGTTTVSVTATDSENPAGTVTAPVAVTVNPAPALTFTGSLPNATVGVSYSQTLHASGGVAPYTYALTAGALPPGLTLASNGTVSGTPTAPGASSFTVTATDSEGTPKTASLPLVLLVVYPFTPIDPILNGPYAFLFQGYDDSVAGVLAYQTAMVGSFTADGAGALNAGELDANHQTSTPTGTTVSSNGFLGTYTIGADYRGSLTITTLNADGTTAKTSTYAIAVKAPVSPATMATSGSLIEFDSNQFQGTKGSGTFLAQTASAFTAGLKGSYAFGMQGDTPCTPACTVGISAGPAAAVGQIAANGTGSVTGGTGDEGIANTTYANSALSGTYGTADGNGRLPLSLNTANMPLGTYPVDYAVYVVNANQAFLMSTDKHSSYILLSGQMQLQTGTFSNASMTGPYVGYENTATNPGLVGATLQNVANLSTATIFRGTGNGTGTCTTTNVDVGGTTGLVNGLTGLGSGVSVLNAVLGTYQTTGNSNCTVAANGRGVINYPLPGGLLSTTLQLLGLSTNPPAPRVAYLYGPNQGFFLETGYAGLGRLEAQTGTPFSNATLNGTYIYQTSPAASAASTDTSGVFIADGAGHATTTYDTNVGVGTLNVLQLGTISTANYNLTDAAAGRFLLGSNTVIYAISPGRFVLLDTSATTTSPSVALLF